MSLGRSQPFTDTSWSKLRIFKSVRYKGHYRSTGDRLLRFEKGIRMSGCVKKPYEEKAAQKEVFVLCSAEHKNFFGKLIRWSYEYCESCKAFHIFRDAGGSRVKHND